MDGNKERTLPFRLLIFLNRQYFRDLIIIMIFFAIFPLNFRGFFFLSLEEKIDRGADDEGGRRLKLLLFSLRFISFYIYSFEKVEDTFPLEISDWFAVNNI